MGTAAIVFSEMYPKAKIITIEPSLDNFDILQRNIAKYKNIKAIHGALSASIPRLLHFIIEILVCGGLH